jgi:DNA-binding transcriptional LysR family regulator
VAGFATAIRRTLLPIALDLATDRPGLRLRVHEHEPDEAIALLAGDGVDLALVYDYDLAPAAFDQTLVTAPLWRTTWALAVPAECGPVAGTATAAFAAHRERDWIVNSRGTADERAVRIVASMAGFEPRVVHRIDSLDLVEDVVAGGFGVALLPADRPVGPRVRLLPLRDPEVVLRSYAVVRRGRTGWPPLALLLRLLTARAPG